MKDSAEPHTRETHSCSGWTKRHVRRTEPRSRRAQPDSHRPEAQRWAATPRSRMVSFALAVLSSFAGSSIGSPLTAAQDLSSPSLSSLVVPHPPATSISVGRFNRGRLLRGREIFESTHVRLKHPEGDQHHGTDEIVILLQRAAGEVARLYPGSRLTVGDISRRGGGRMRPHLSHQSGRDVDIGFYVRHRNGALVYLDQFIDFRPDGSTRVSSDLVFDDARNWALIEALVSQNEAPVQWIFIAEWLRARLLAYAVAIGVDQELIRRASIVMEQPSHGGRHEDHFHMRVFCASEDRARCWDDAPFRDWVTFPTHEELVEVREAYQRERRAQSRERRTRRAERERAEERRRARRALAERTSDEAQGG